MIHLLCTIIYALKTIWRTGRAGLVLVMRLNTPESSGVCCAQLWHLLNYKLTVSINVRNRILVAERLTRFKSSVNDTHSHFNTTYISEHFGINSGTLMPEKLWAGIKLNSSNTQLVQYFDSDLKSALLHLAWRDSINEDYKEWFTQIKYDCSLGEILK